MKEFLGSYEKFIEQSPEELECSLRQMRGIVGALTKQLEYKYTLVYLKDMRLYRLSNRITEKFAKNTFPSPYQSSMEFYQRLVHPLLKLLVEMS